MNRFMSTHIQMKTAMFTHIHMYIPTEHTLMITGIFILPSIPRLCSTGWHAS